LGEFGARKQLFFPFPASAVNLEYARGDEQENCHGAHHFDGGKPKIFTPLELVFSMKPPSGRKDMGNMITWHGNYDAEFLGKIKSRRSSTAVNPKFLRHWSWFFRRNRPPIERIWEIWSHGTEIMMLNF
jgi:hypothetical protein